MKNVWNFQVFQYTPTINGGLYTMKPNFPEKYESLLITLAPVLKSCYFKSLLLLDKEDKTELFIFKNNHQLVPFSIKIRHLD